MKDMRRRRRRRRKKRREMEAQFLLECLCRKELVEGVRRGLLRRRRRRKRRMTRLWKWRKARRCEIGCCYSSILKMKLHFP